MTLDKEHCVVTLDTEDAEGGGGIKRRPVLHVLMSDGRTTEFRHVAVAIPEAPADEAEAQVLWLAVNGNGQPFQDPDGNYIVRESPALALGRMTPAPSDLVSIREISLRTGMSASTIEREVERGKLAGPIRLSPRRNVWRYADVEQWMQRRKSGRP